MHEGQEEEWAATATRNFHTVANTNTNTNTNTAAQPRRWPQRNPAAPATLRTPQQRKPHSSANCEPHIHPKVRDYETTLVVLVFGLVLGLHVHPQCLNSDVTLE